MVHFRLPALPPELPDQKLHSIALFVLAVPEAMKDAEDGFGGVDDLSRGHERKEQVAGLARNRGSSSDSELEAPLAAAVAVEDLGAPPQVVDRRERVVFEATFKGDLEFARERRAQGVPQQVTGQRFRIGRHVEDLVRRHARVGAAGDVAHRVSTGFAGGQAGIGQQPHRVLHIAELHEVELDVLSGGDVTEASRMALGHLRQRVELTRIQNSLRNLDPQHLNIALPLPIGAANQAKSAPLVGRQGARLELFERGDEFVDVCFAGK